MALFVVASWTLVVSPGPDMLYVITRGISQGHTAGLLSALGVTTGHLVHTILVALGLGVRLAFTRCRQGVQSCVAGARR